MIRPSVRVLRFLFVLLAGGCATTTPLKYVDREVTPELVQRAVQMNHDGIQSLAGSGRIAIETPEIAQSGSFQIWVRKPDTLIVKFEGPFGIEVGSALVTRHEFALYNSFQNQLLIGSTNAENMSRLLRVNLGFDDVMNLFMGGFFLPEDRASPQEIETGDDFVVFVYRGDSRHRRYWIEPHSHMITRIQHLDPDGKPLLEQRFLNYRPVDRFQIPYNLRAIMPRDRRMVSVSFSEVVLNSSTPQFTFTVPHNAERIRLQ